MKTIKYLAMVLMLLTTISCKDEIYGVVTQEKVKVYLPWAQGESHLYSVLDSGTVLIDTIFNTVNFPIPVLRGGFMKNETFTVNTSKDDANVNSLLASGALPDTVMLLPSDRYTLDAQTKLTDSAFQNRGTVMPMLKIANLNDFSGKTIAIGIKISDASKFGINENQNRVVILIDVDKLVQNYLKIEVTAKYLKNPGDPFKRKDSSTGRWGLLKDWDTSVEFINQAGNTAGSFVNDDGGLLALESTNWDAAGVTNGKISQTVTLSEGSYSFELLFKDFNEYNGSIEWDSPDVDINFAVALGTSLPDIGNVSTALSSYRVVSSTPKGKAVETQRFTLDKESTITFGMVATIPTATYLQMKKIALIKYL